MASLVNAEVATRQPRQSFSPHQYVEQLQNDEARRVDITEFCCGS
ncbi:MAG: hypothetical protein AAF892_16300 [Cyanobacteria bacterium P01_D01_bin.71]